MSEVKLLKRKVPYVDKEGKDRIATNFFLSCGDVMIPIEVKYFENKETGRDDRYLERKTVLSAFAETLPEKEERANRPAAQKKKASAGEQADEADESIPF
ncbi:MAG: hypothetical protein ACI4SH_00715 [Candidatus Scatosoma sp.]